MRRRPRNFVSNLAFVSIGTRTLRITELATPEVYTAHCDAISTSHAKLVHSLLGAHVEPGIKAGIEFSS